MSPPRPSLAAAVTAAFVATAAASVVTAVGEHPVVPARIAHCRRAAVFDESLQLLRAVLNGDSGPEGVTFTGTFFTVSGVNLGSRPAAPLDIWLGGSAPAAFRRIGRFGDGWLGSFLTPAEAGRARERIQAEAAEAGREIEPDHFGISLAVAEGGVDDGTAAAIRSRRPDVDPTQ